MWSGPVSMVWPRAVPVPEVLLPGPSELSADRIGILPTPGHPAGDQPVGARLALSIQVLPQAGDCIGGFGSTEAAVEVDRHANQVVAATGPSGGADLPSKLLEIVGCEHRSILA